MKQGQLSAIIILAVGIPSLVYFIVELLTAFELYDLFSALILIFLLSIAMYILFKKKR